MTIDPPVTEYCEELAAIRCDAEPICCTEAERRSTDDAACIRTAFERCSSVLHGRAFEDGRVTFDPVNARLDLEATAEEASTCSPMYSGVPVVTGHAGVGGDCSVSEEDVSGRFACASGLICADSAGVCIEPAANPIGAACSYHEQCAAGLSCFDGICGPRLPAGSACETWRDCSSYACADGVCTQPTFETIPTFETSHWYCVGGR